MKFDFTEVPTLTTERLVLRAVTMEDAPEIFALRSDPLVMRHIGRPIQETVQEALNLIGMMQSTFEAKDGIAWAITLHNQPKLVGTTGFWRMDKDHSRAELGYMLSPEWQGKGIMQEANKAVLRFGFREMQFNSVEARLDPDNLASVRVLERLGFKKEGHLRKNYFCRGVYTDTGLYGLLHDEFK